MAWLQLHRSRKRPWKAHAIRDGVSISLGMFATREEALAAEQAFHQEWPSKRMLPSEQQQRTEQIRSLRAQGMTYQEIGDKLGLTKQAVSSWNKRHK